MTVLGPEARDVLAAGRLAHLVTINPDGSPQVSIVWVGLDRDEIVSGHLGLRQKLRNVERDPRVVLSLETGHRNTMGLDDYLVVRGTARVTEGERPSCCGGSHTSTSAPTRGSRPSSTRPPATCCASHPRASAASAPGRRSHRRPSWA
jgi:PPOX class probable F420-dependent enzyme